MARPLRITYPGAVYHVMNRGASRKRVFAQHTDYEMFLQLLAECHRRWDVEVLAYCLMGNHYHLCLRTPEENLPRVMRHVNGVYTQHVNRTQGRDGPLFRGRYKALVVESNSYLSAVIRYIHLNPVKAKLVSKPEAYQWSSHAKYLRRKTVPAWLNVEKVLSGFESSRDFQEFVLTGNDEDLEAYYAAGRQSPVLGSDAFRTRLKKHTGKLSREHPRIERVGVRPSVDRVVRAVAKTYDVTASTLRTGRRGKLSEGRKVALYLVPRICDWTLQATADYFGLSSYGGASWAGSQIRKKRDSEPSFRRKLERLELLILPQ